jgi:predicted ATPase
MKFTKKFKKETLSYLINYGIISQAHQDDNLLVELLDEVLDLRTLPSEDSRFDNALEDSYQHLVNNFDWDLNYTIFERFKFEDSDEAFINLIEVSLKQKYQITEKNIIDLVNNLNDALAVGSYALIQEGEDKDGYPLFKLRKASSRPKKLESAKNNITFYLESEFENEIEDLATPYFLLRKIDWNDYSLWTKFSLNYRSSDQIINIGDLKIISNNAENYNRSELSNDFIRTDIIIPNSFDQLNESFCSLGQDTEFYSSMKRILGNKYERILNALNDVATNNDILDKFESSDNFKDSLIRSDKAARAMRNAKFILAGHSNSSLLNFKYNFKPPYSELSEVIEIDFNQNGQFSNNLKAFIGKNGVGKSSLIKKMVRDFFGNDDKPFKPGRPPFDKSKVIVLAYSTFDNYNELININHKNFKFCGPNPTKDSIESRNEKFTYASKRIKSIGRMTYWMKILSHIIDESVIERTFRETEDYESDFNPKDPYDVIPDKLIEWRDTMSSGESILLEIITDLVANITYDSIIFFDEPETHLHPTYISQLILLITRISKKYESLCVVMTHSPIVIQELLSSDVYVMSRNDNQLFVGKSDIQTFGQNLSILTEKVFGNQEIEKQYQSRLKKYFKNITNSEDLIRQIEEDDGLPLSLNVRLMIENILKGNA